jgi:predicted HTH transcriptional regulator
MEKYVKDLIRTGESNIVEFKKTINGPEKIAKPLTAFANSKGGYLFIGVDDNKQIIGVQAEEELFVLDKAANFFCYPPVNIEIQEHVTDDFKTVLEVYIPESSEKPHAIKDKEGVLKVYVRVNDQCLLAAPSVISALKKEYPVTEQTPAALSNNEKMLIAYLQKKQKITLKDFAKLINVSKRRASRILQSMIINGQIFEHSFEKVSFYTLN